MSTILPTDGQRRTLNVTTFQIGDTVRSNVDGRIGTIITPNNLIPTLVGPDIIYLPQPITQLPLATPAQPVTSRVNVQWIDGTQSIVELSTLGRP